MFRLREDLNDGHFKTSSALFRSYCGSRGCTCTLEILLLACAPNVLGPQRGLVIFIQLRYCLNQPTVLAPIPLLALYYLPYEVPTRSQLPSHERPPDYQNIEDCPLETRPYHLPLVLLAKVSEKAPPQSNNKSHICMPPRNFNPPLARAGCMGTPFRHDWPRAKSCPAANAPLGKISSRSAANGKIPVTLAYAFNDYREQRFRGSNLSPLSDQR